MTTPGYPDYTRIVRAGNQNLFVAGATLANGANIYRGYVGSWPYTIIFCDMATTTDFMRIRMQYYTDNTFTTLLGFRYSIRGSANFSCLSYGNMSDYLSVFIDTKSGNPIPVQTFGIYATMGTSEQIMLDSNDVPLLFFSGTVAASTLQQVPILHVHPGLAKLKMKSAGASWQPWLYYYDWGSGAYVSLIGGPQFAAAGTYETDFPQIDAPMQVGLQNLTAAGVSMFATLWQAAL